MLGFSTKGISIALLCFFLGAAALGASRLPVRFVDRCTMKWRIIPGTNNDVEISCSGDCTIGECHIDVEPGGGYVCLCDSSFPNTPCRGVVTPLGGEFYHIQCTTNTCPSSCYVGTATSEWTSLCICPS